MRRLKGKTLLAMFLAGIVTALIWFAHMREPEFLVNVRELVFDRYQSILPRKPQESSVIIVDVDEHSLKAYGQWPWPRTLMAEMVLKLRDAGALAIGFDMVFAETDRTDPKAALANIGMLQSAELTRQLSELPANDDVFAEAIGDAPVVLGFPDAQGAVENVPRKVAGISWLGEDLHDELQSLDGAVVNLPVLEDAASGNATFTLGSRQSDDIIRTVPMFIAVGSSVYPSLSIETLRVAIQTASGEDQSYVLKTSLASGEISGGLRSITEGRVADFIFPTTEDGQLRIYYAKDESTQHIPATAVLGGDSVSLKNTVEGRIVLVGTSASGLRDIRTTALREKVPGVAIHAQIIDQIMEGVFLKRPDWAQGLERLALAATSLMLILALPFIGPFASAIFGGVVAMLAVAGSWLAFSRYGLLVDPLFPLLSSLLVYAVMTVMLFAFAEREKRFVRQAFRHYLAPDLLNKLEQSPDTLKLGGEIRDLSLMFMDIRGFTAISEKLDPQELVTFLNRLLSPLSEIIQKNEGAIDKYIGDSIMAFWNAPLDVEDHPEKACRAALQMFEELDKMNKRDVFGFGKTGLGNVGIGIGINSGEGCVGNMGSTSRFDYSVIGDTVNVAARLEAASKEVGWPILVSEPTTQNCPEFAFLEAGRLMLKGKSEPQRVFALVGDEKFAASKQFTAVKEAHSSLLGVLKPENSLAIEENRKRCLELAPEKLHTFYRLLGSSMVERNVK